MKRRITLADKKAPVYGYTSLTPRPIDKDFRRMVKPRGATGAGSGMVAQKPP